MPSGFNTSVAIVEADQIASVEGSRNKDPGAIQHKASVCLEAVL